MTIMEVKRQIGNHLGDVVKLKYSLGRNKYEEYEVMIKELYDNIFLVEQNDLNGKIVKSFSYRDVMTKLVHIDY